MKKIIKYNKLVRDKIPDVLKQKGIKYITHKAEGAEYFNTLVSKLKEEVEEFAKDANEEEVADILEVLNTIIEEKGFSRDSIEVKRLQKLADRGGFRNKTILEQTEE